MATVKAWLNDGKIVMQQGRVCLDPSCPCVDIPCTGTTPDESTQPNVVVTNMTCICDGAGTLNGSYPLYAFSEAFPPTATPEGDIWEWFGTTTCDVSPGPPFFADITVTITCLSNGLWRVAVSTYQYEDGIGACNMTGFVDTDAISVNDSDEFVGTVNLTLTDTGCGTTPDCTMTLTFGP